MKEKLINFVTAQPKKTIFIVIALSLIMASGIQRITFDDNIVNMLPKNLPSRKILDRFEDVFGRADRVFPS